MALTDLLVAVAIGIAFGFALERAGLGSARKLTGQFFLTDFTVFKVMFTRDRHGDARARSGSDASA